MIKRSRIRFEQAPSRPSSGWCLSILLHESLVHESRSTSCTMHGCSSDTLRAVRRCVAPAPRSILPGARARCAAWHRQKALTTVLSGSKNARSTRSPPPPLLPAPDAAIFSTAAKWPDLGRLQHFAAWLSPRQASERELAALIKREEAAAKYRDQVAELVRHKCLTDAPIVCHRHSLLNWNCART